VNAYPLSCLLPWNNSSSSRRLDNLRYQAPCSPFPGLWQCDNWVRCSTVRTNAQGRPGIRQKSRGLRVGFLVGISRIFTCFSLVCATAIENFLRGWCIHRSELAGWRGLSPACAALLRARSMLCLAIIIASFAIACGKGSRDCWSGRAIAGGTTLPTRKLITIPDVVD
jgi:hypothetical protein